MAVYFVYRCHYGAPSEKHVRRFEYDTVLDWAQSVFRQVPENEAFEYAQELLGGLHVYSFGSMFFTPPGDSPFTRPETMEDVHGWFQGMYDQGSANGPHHVQILTDDDELDMAVYLFDDHYRTANPGKADFLLLPDWELPGDVPDAPASDLSAIRTELVGPPGDSEGVLYSSDLCPCSENLRDKNDCDRALRIEGLRVPDLTRYLLRRAENEAYDSGLRTVRVNLAKLLAEPISEDAGFLAAIRDEPDERTHWGVYSDWLQERGLPLAGLHLLERALRMEASTDGRDNRNAAFDRVKVTPHMAQACKNEGRWPDAPATEMTDRDTFSQFIFFDDRWAAAHPALAAGILTFASRWDVLS